MFLLFHIARDLLVGTGSLKNLVKSRPERKQICSHSRWVSPMSYIKPRNFLLDATLNIKTINFSGSSLDGSKPASGEGTRFYLPRHWRDPPTVATDLFALGSTH
jgi:hypothetical protein